MRVVNSFICSIKQKGNHGAQLIVYNGIVISRQGKPGGFFYCVQDVKKGLTNGRGAMPHNKQGRLGGYARGNINGRW
jgi:hypothetical protein